MTGTIGEDAGVAIEQGVPGNEGSDQPLDMNDLRAAKSGHSSPANSGNQELPSITTELPISTEHPVMDKPVGFLDHIEGRIIRGWAWFPTNAQLRLTAEILINRDIRQRVLADTFRGDLAEAGIGDGRYGFEIEVSLPSTLTGVAIEVDIVIPEFDFRFPGFPREIIFPPSLVAASNESWHDNHVAAATKLEPLRPELVSETKPPAEAVASLTTALEQDPQAQILMLGKASGAEMLRSISEPDVIRPLATAVNDGVRAAPIRQPEGSITFLSKGKIEGWAWLPIDPQQRLTAEISLNGVPLTQVNMSDYSVDLRDAGIGDGRYNFSIELAVPNTLRAGTNQIDITIPAHNFRFPGFPRDIELPARQPDYKGFVDAASADVLAGWVQSTVNDSEIVDVELVAGGTVVRAARADVRRPDVSEHPHGFKFALSDLTKEELGTLMHDPVVVRVASTGIPLTIAPNIDLPTILAGIRAQRYITTARVVSGMTIVGKAIDRLDPSKPMTILVHLKDFAEPIRIRADRWQNVDIDGAKQRIQCGFRITLPATLMDGARHAVYLTTADGKPFPGEPLVVNGAIGGVGNVEEITRTRVAGWAMTYLSSTAPVIVEVLVGDRVHGSGPADKFRPDVAATAQSSGFHGFTIQLDRPLLIADLETLTVRLQDSGTQISLSPKRLRESQAKFGPDPIAPNQPRTRKLVGHIDNLNQNGASGWALDLNAPGDRVSVDLALDGIVVSTAAADAFRHDVARNFGTNGRHGFSIAFPAGMGLHGEHKVEVRFTADNTPVPGNHKAITFETPGLTHPIPGGVRDAYASQNSLYRPSRRTQPRTEPARVALIVVNLNGAAHLERLFSSFYYYNTYAYYRFVIIDHGSLDESQIVCRKWANNLNIKFVQRGRNWSFSASNNYGVDLCNEELIVFLNNDIIFNQNVLELMTPFFDDDQVGILGVKLQTPPPAHSPQASFVQHIGVKFGTFLGDRVFQPYELPVHPGVHRASVSAWRVAAVTAALMMVRREDFLTLGGFDERYFYSYEDVDFCLAFRARFDKDIICANYITAYHFRGATRLYTDPETRERYSKNRLLLEARFGSALRQELRQELFQETRLCRLEPLRIAFAVSTTAMDAPEGDFFTAYELGEELVKAYKWDVQYLPPANWYDLDSCDVLVVMRHDFNPNKIKKANPNLIVIGWARNWFEGWLNGPMLPFLDLIWTASQKSLDIFSERVNVPIDLIRIATNEERFRQQASRDRIDPALQSDYCFTGSFFGAPRKLIDCLDPEVLPFEFSIFGHNWEKVSSLKPYYKGKLPYTRIPDVYAATRVVLDDANPTVANYGSVNSRVFDALASGALVLTNGAVGALEVFGDLMPVFGSKATLSSLLARYLGNEEERKSLAKQLQSIVLERHTYKHRASEVFQSLKRLFVDGPRFSIRRDSDASVTVNTTAGLLRECLRAEGHFVRPWAAPSPVETTRRLGDDVVIHLTEPAPLDKIRPAKELQESQFNVRFHLGGAAELWLKDCARYDALLITSALGLAFSAEQLGRPIISLSAGADPEDHLLSQVRGEIAFRDIRRFRAALAKQLPVLLALKKDQPNSTTRVENSQSSESYDDETVTINCADLVFYPDYSETNPYQQLLYKDFSPYFSIQAGDIRHALGLQAKRDGKRSVIFHLHWTSVVLGIAATRPEALNRKALFLELLRTFIDNGGTFVWTVHNVMPHEVEFADIEADLCCQLAAWAACIHVHSPLVPELSRPYYSLPSSKVVVAQHGNYIGEYADSIDRVGARQRLKLAEDELVFLFVGQVRSYKGVDELVRAFASLRRIHPKVRLVIAGHPVEVDTESLRRQTADIEGVDLVLRRIPDNELQYFLRAADYAVLPYRKVLTSGSVYLALSYGVPVIAPAEGILPDLLNDGVDSFLYLANDADGLLSAMKRAAATTDIEAMRVAALERAQRSTWDETRSRLAHAFIGALIGTPATVLTEAGTRECVIRYPRDRQQQDARVATVVLHYAHLSDTVRCVSSLLSQNTPDHHIYIVSNDSDGRSFAYLSRIFPGCTIIQSPENLGYAGGNNLALALVKDADYDYAWIVNPDVVVPDNLLRRLIEIGDQHQHISIFGSKIMFGDRPDLVWFGGGKVEWQDGFETQHLYIGKSPGVVPAEPFPCDYVTGASLFFRRDLLNDVGLIPERYFLYFEEADWCMRASALGRRIMMFPETSLYHHKRSESDGLPTLVYLYYFSRNIVLICRRFSPDKIEETVRRFRRTAEIWLNRISERTPARSETAEAAIERGLADGLAGVEGRADLTDLLMRERLDLENADCRVTPTPLPAMHEA